jgi:hypothetical protein
MKRFVTVVLVLAVCFPVLGRTASGLDGNYVDDPQLLKKYGKVAYSTLIKHKEIASAIKQALPIFKTKDVEISFPPTAVFKANDGKKYLILSGCTRDDCGGTVNVIVYDIAAKKAYLLREKEGDIFGNPSQEIRKLLNYHHENR